MTVTLNICYKVSDKYIMELHDSHFEYLLQSIGQIHYNVFVRYFVADIQSDCHAAPPETYA